MMRPVAYEAVLAFELLLPLRVIFHPLSYIVELDRWIHLLGVLQRLLYYNGYRVR